MPLRLLPQRKRRSAKARKKPRGWAYSGLLDADVPKTSLEVWRLGPDHRELERVLTPSGEPLALPYFEGVPSLSRRLTTPGFYRVIARGPKGRIIARRDCQVAFWFSPDWRPETARSSYEPMTRIERLAVERDDLRAKLDAAEAARQQAESERDSALARVDAAEQAAEARIAEVLADADRCEATAWRDRATAERLAEEAIDEARRLRRLLAKTSRTAGSTRDVEPELDGVDESATEEPPDEPAPGSPLDEPATDDRPEAPNTAGRATSSGRRARRARRSPPRPTPRPRSGWETLMRFVAEHPDEVAKRVWAIKALFDPKPTQGQPKHQGEGAESAGAAERPGPDGQPSGSEQVNA